MLPAYAFSTSSAAIFPGGRVLAHPSLGTIQVSHSVDFADMPEPESPGKPGRPVWCPPTAAATMSAEPPDTHGAPHSEQ